MAALRWGATTHPGLVRTENEDTFVAEPMVFAVADGMGGHQAGEVASALAASIVRDRLGGGAASEDAAASVIAEANAAIYGASKANAAQTGMGTTVTAIAVLHGETDDDEQQLVLLNVGDSRTYRFRNGRLQRVTVDHSYVQELVASGHISQEEARTHPRRNIVTRALGIEPLVRADMWTLPIVRGDRFILASDGLVDEVPDHEILDLVASVEEPQDLSDQLVAMANRHGGRDNVTVVVVDVLEGADPPDPTEDLEFDPAWAEGVQEPTGWVDDELPPPTGVADSWSPVDMPAGADATLAAPRGPAVRGTNEITGETEVIPMLPPPPPPSAPMEAATDMPSGPPQLPDQQPPTQGEPDLAPTTVGAAVPAAALPTLPGGALKIDESVVEAATPVMVKPKRRFTGGVFLFVFVVAAILTVTFTLIAVHARSGYFVGFDKDNTVVVYKGQRDKYLWFEPTVNTRSDFTRDQLSPEVIKVVESHVTFGSAAEAITFITQHVAPPVTTTTTTTTPATSTTIAATSTSSGASTTTDAAGP